MHHRANRGFIALISTTLISSILLALALSVGSGAMRMRFDVLESEYQKIAQGLAESCMELALLRLADDYDYVSAESGIEVGTDSRGAPQTCSITSVTEAEGEDHDSVQEQTVTIKTEARYPAMSGVYSGLTVVATVQNPRFALPAAASEAAFAPIEISSWTITPY